MSIELLESPAFAADPLDNLELAAGALEFESDRVADCELHMVLPGMWRDIGLWFTWRPALSTLQMGAPLDLRATPGTERAAAHLVSLVNEQLWIGHFDLWSEDKAIVYRNAAVLPQNGELDRMQAKALIKGASEAIDRFYPAFNYLIWGGKTPEEAMKASLFETVGTA